MLAEFRPTWMLESIYDLTPKEAQEKNIRLILTDLDNTLIAWNNPNGTPQLRDWLATMNEAGLPVVVVTNNSAKRAARALRQLKLPFVSRALKPLNHGINQAKKRYQVNSSEVVVVGDQLLTDILAANNAHVRSILVKPLVETDAWITKFNRRTERIVKNKLLRKGYLKKTWGHSLNEQK